MHNIITTLVVFVKKYIENLTQRRSSTLSVQGCKDPQALHFQHPNGTTYASTAAVGFRSPQGTGYRANLVADTRRNLCVCLDGILRYPSTAPTNRHNMNINGISLNLYYIKHYSMHYVNNIQTTFTLYIYISLYHV